MARPNSEYPTELELQILKVLWDTEPMTVREVREALATGGRDLAHTTVITMLGTMVDKGQIEKLEPTQGKAFRFSPLIQRNDVSRNRLTRSRQRGSRGSGQRDSRNTEVFSN